MRWIPAFSGATIPGAFDALDGRNGISRTLMRSLRQAKAPLAMTVYRVWWHGRTSPMLLFTETADERPLSSSRRRGSSALREGISSTDFADYTDKYALFPNPLNLFHLL